MIRGVSLTSPYTQLNILFLPPVAPIFPPQSWSYHGKLSLYRWHSAGIPSAHWCYIAGLQTIRDKWLCFHIFKFTSLSTWLLYFRINTLFQLLLQLLIKANISNMYYIFIQPLSWFLDFGLNDFEGLKIRQWPLGHVI